MRLHLGNWSGGYFDTAIVSAPCPRSAGDGAEGQAILESPLGRFYPDARS